VEKLIVWWELKATFFTSLQKVLQKKEDNEALITAEGEEDLVNWVETLENVIFTQLVPKVCFRLPL
jgi:hypothetical protein